MLLVKLPIGSEKMKLPHKRWNGKIWALFIGGLTLILGLSGWAFYIISAPMVSVVLPVYNGTKNNYLHRSIPSILNQTFKDLELILIDDGSSDNSWEVLKAYAALDSRIKLLKNDRNRGISYSRNRGNDLARGKYIMPMDQDDDNRLDRIVKQVAFMEERPWLDITATPSITPAPWVSTYTQDGTRFYLFMNNNFGHPNTMVKRSFLLKNHIRYNENIKCANDYDWLLQIRDHDGHFGYMYEALFIYNGANYSKPGGPCYDESKEIISHFAPIDQGLNKFICHVSQMAQRTPKYAKLFTPGYLGTIEKEYCVKDNK